MDDLLFGFVGDFLMFVVFDELVMGVCDVEWWLGVGWLGFFVIKLVLFGGDLEGVLGKFKVVKVRVVFLLVLEMGIGV